MPTPGPLEMLTLAVLVAPFALLYGLYRWAERRRPTDASRPSRVGHQAPAATVGDELARLASLRDSGALTAAAFDAQRARLLAEAQAGPGMVCGRCAKPLSPAWRGKCNHCKALYADFHPTPRASIDGT